MYGTRYYLNFELLYILQCFSNLSLGSAVLVVTSTDVDKSGASYYGEQTLHYIGVDGESSMVQLGMTQNIP